MAAKPAAITRWIRRSLATDPPRSKSLIITIFGDSLLPLAPHIWLSELNALLEPFGVNAQLARTSCFRLAEEGWLQSDRLGRRSRYALTPSGGERVEHAYDRIYAPPARNWNGDWTIVILNNSSASRAARTELRRELEWECFGLLASGIFVHPRADRASLKEILARLRRTRDVTVLQARDITGFSASPSTMLANDCWNLDRVAAHYRGFLKRFQPVLPLLDAAGNDASDNQCAFLVQTLLIHSFRRVVLHDPRLPAALLPADWPGYLAFDLCSNIYRRTFQPAGMHLQATLAEADAKPWPRAFIKRFGGLAN
jgi:phenylacetic acid degradation operon negative regulatory protein